MIFFTFSIFSQVVIQIFWSPDTNETVRRADPKESVDVWSVLMCGQRPPEFFFFFMDNIYTLVLPLSERMSCWNTSSLHIYIMPTKLCVLKLVKKTKSASTREQCT